MKKSRRPGAVTIADIGRELGISAMTVSRALNGSPDVNEETRLRVLDHAEKINYRPNRWARSLVTSRSHIIGIIVPDISHNFFSEITRNVQETLEQHGYDLMLCHTHSAPEREQAAIEMLLGSRVDGLIVASEQAEDQPEIFEAMLREGTPFVLIDRFFPALECARVRTDDYQVGRIATEHLISLGHRRIAHIRGPQVSVGRLRLQGYLDALTENRLDVREEYIQASSFGQDQGREAMRQLLALPEPPTAVFATNDPAAIGAIHACREAGLNVPSDVSIVGAGSVEGNSYPNPFLTTADWSRREMGILAAQLLLAQMEHGLSSEERIVAPSLLLRQSTAPPAPEEITACFAAVSRSSA